MGMQGHILSFFTSGTSQKLDSRERRACVHVCVCEGPFYRTAQGVKGSSDRSDQDVCLQHNPFLHKALAMLRNGPWGLALPAFKPELQSQLHLRSFKYPTLERQPQGKPTLAIFMGRLFFSMGLQLTAGNRMLARQQKRH